jgi:hypothetical protein
MGYRLCREVDRALFGSTFFVIAGTAHRTSCSCGSAVTCDSTRNREESYNITEIQRIGAVESWGEVL